MRRSPLRSGPAGASGRSRRTFAYLASRPALPITGGVGGHAAASEEGARADATPRRRRGLASEAPAARSAAAAVGGASAATAQVEPARDSATSWSRAHHITSLEEISRVRSRPSTATATARILDSRSSAMIVTMPMSAGMSVTMSVSVHEQKP